MRPRLLRISRVSDYCPDRPCPVAKTTIRQNEELYALSTGLLAFNGVSYKREVKSTRRVSVAPAILHGDGPGDGDVTREDA